MGGGGRRERQDGGRGRTRKFHARPSLSSYPSGRCARRSSPHTPRQPPCVTPAAGENGTLSLLSYPAERGWGEAGVETCGGRRRHLLPVGADLLCAAAAAASPPRLWCHTSGAWRAGPCLPTSRTARARQWREGGGGATTPRHLPRGGCQAAPALRWLVCGGSWKSSAIPGHPLPPSAWGGAGWRSVRTAASRVGYGRAQRWGAIAALSVRVNLCGESWPWPHHVRGAHGPSPAGGRLRVAVAPSPTPTNLIKRQGAEGS